MMSEIPSILVVNNKGRENKAFIKLVSRVRSAIPSASVRVSESGERNSSGSLQEVVLWLSGAICPPSATPSISLRVNGKCLKKLSSWEVFVAAGLGSTIELSVTLEGPGLSSRTAVARLRNVLHACMQVECRVLDTLALLVAKVIRGDVRSEPAPDRPLKTVHRGGPTGVRKLATCAIAFVMHVFYGAFVSQRWRIGTLNGRASDLAGRIAVDRVTWVAEMARGNFLADPFPLPDGSKALVCEWKRPKKGRGVIARVEANAIGFRPEPEQILELADLHLSYPFTLAIEGQVWIVPECSHGNELAAYLLDDSCRRVLERKVILDHPIVDPTISFFGSRWWLFGTGVGSSERDSHLYVYWSKNPLGPWTPHETNPVLIDASSARPAGHCWVENGTLFRPTQDCGERYGGAVNVQCVERLTPNDFCQRLAWRIEPPRGYLGLHTIGASNDLVSIDIYRNVFDPLAWLDRLMERPDFRRIFRFGERR